MNQRSAVIVGGGPVGCAVALGLRRRSFDVHVYERSDDPRRTPPAGRHSFNITLSYRGLRTVEPAVRERLYRDGVQLSHRAVHLDDGTVFWQPYGLFPDHHLLSIPRLALHACLLDAAEGAGAQLHFRHACVGVSPRETAATFVSDDSVIEVDAGLLAGCDGANSVVRRALAQRVGLTVSKERAQHGYVELTMPGGRGRAHPLTDLRPGPGARSTHGLHLWPRGDHLLLAQPNLDGSYTATIFLPFRSESPDGPSFDKLDDDNDVTRFFQRQFPDAVDLLPRLTEEFWAAPPARLKTVRCQPFHHDRTMLLGDAAHTMLPFYGQGINCSLEDLEVLLGVLDRNLSQREVGSAIRETLTEVERLRRPTWDAIAALSRKHLHDLASDLADPRWRARGRLELELHRAAPSSFIPLYLGIAFSSIPYDEVAQLYGRHRRDLDEVCEQLGTETDATRIIEAYLTLASQRERAGTRVGPELELSAAEKDKLLDLTGSYLARYHADLAAGRPPASYVQDSVNLELYDAGRQLSRALRDDEVPTAGIDVQALLSEIFDVAVAAGTVHPHAGFMAHVPSGGLFQGAVGDFIARALNRFPGVWVAAPGLVQLEANVVRWFCSLLGYGPGSFGYLTTSGSISNQMGLQCGVRRSEEASPPQTVYTSEQGHYSILKAARLVGIPPSRTRVVPCGADYRLDVDELERWIRRDRAQGLRPSCVVATAGTTNTGAIDDLIRLAELSRAEGLWLHVDACFGGFFRITARGRAALAGIEAADSIAVDAHKSLFLPHGSSALLVKDGATLLATFERPEAGYLPGRAPGPEFVDFCNYGPELSREMRGLTAWLPIKMHGIAAFERALDTTLDLASDLASKLQAISGIEVVRDHPLHLPVVAFKVDARDSTRRARLNEELCSLICATGRTYVTTTTLPDHGVVVRACILNHRTDQATVDMLVTDVRGAMRQLPWR